MDGHGLLVAQTAIDTAVDTAVGVVWGPLLLIPLLLLTGLYLTVVLRGLQFRTLLRGLKLAFVHRDEAEAVGDISHYQALTTALAATIGVGNIAGVGDRHPLRWARRAVLDVGDRPGRHGHQVRRGVPRGALPRDRR